MSIFKSTAPPKATLEGQAVTPMNGHYGMPKHELTGVAKPSVEVPNPPPSVRHVPNAT